MIYLCSSFIFNEFLFITKGPQFKSINGFSFSLNDEMRRVYEFGHQKIQKRYSLNCIFIDQELQKMSNTVVHVYNRICPFAQRSWITLLEKEVPFEKKEFSLTKKPAEFTQIYRRAYGNDPKSDGKVPILIHGDKVFAQSDLISWYVAEEFHTGTELIPKSSEQRLKLRWFAQQVAGKVISAFYSAIGYHKMQQAQKDKVVAKINDALSRFQSHIVGPYVLGEQFTLADILIYPFLERWIVIEKYYGLNIPQEYPKVLKLKSEVFNRPSVQKTRQETSDEYFINEYHAYFGN